MLSELFSILDAPSSIFEEIEEGIKKAPLKRAGL